MLTNTAITIYNQYIVSRAEVYQLTVISDVAFEYRDALDPRNLRGDSARVFIPNARGTAYLDPIAWLALVTKTGKWTIAVGDVIVKGSVSDVIQSTPTVFTMTDLRKKYEHVYTITAVARWDQGTARMNHWEVGLK